MGRYYLREWEHQTIILNEEGRELCKIEDGNIGFHCLGSSKNGKIYILYNTPEINPTHMEIASFNIDKKRLEVEKTNDFLPLDDIYSVIEAGGKWDFLIRGIKRAYKYNLGESKAKTIIDSFIVEQFDYNSSTSCFFKDRKLLIIAKRQRIGETIPYGDVRFCYYAY